MEVIVVYKYSTRPYRLTLFVYFFNRACGTFESFEDALRNAAEHGGCLCLNQYNYQAYHYMADPTILVFF